MSTTNKRKGHVPYRMCVVCKNMFPKSELVRLIKNNEGIIIPDEKSMKSGKGIYICINRDCINSFLNDRRYRRTYHGSLTGEAFKLLVDISQTFSTIKGNR